MILLAQALSGHVTLLRSAIGQAYDVTEGLVTQSMTWRPEEERREKEGE